MDQTRKTRKVQMRRLMGRTRAYFSNPANIILLIFFVALCFLTLYPLLSMLLDHLLEHHTLTCFFQKRTAVSTNFLQHAICQTLKT